MRPSHNNHTTHRNIAQVSQRNRDYHNRDYASVNKRGRCLQFGHSGITVCAAAAFSLRCDMRKYSALMSMPT